MMFKPILVGFPAICLTLILSLPGCQDYGFEELPSSSFREKRVNITVTVSSEVDILFVMDNSRSMVGEQTAIAKSFSSFVGVLNKTFGEEKYRIAVITTGMESLDCGPCPLDNPTIFSCMNETGECGRFQNRLGHNIGTASLPEFEFETRAGCKVNVIENSCGWCPDGQYCDLPETQDGCKVIDFNNLDCFYDSEQEHGVIFVGINGCGYERGLAPIRSALSEPLISTWNNKFLRPDATLAVVVISDEEDCGEVGDVTEQISGWTGKICYYAAKGVGPDGSLSDPGGVPYRLTPVREYYDFLVGLKEGRKDLVKFAAIVGIEDPDNPSATQITYVSEEPNAEQNHVCETPGCVDACEGLAGCIKNCKAYPGTRYVALAELFGIGEDENGFVATICQQDFSKTLEELGEFVGCPREFKLSEEILDPGLANILIDGVPVPRYSCSNSEKDNVIKCTGTGDDSTCTGGSCVETWSWTAPEDIDPPVENAPGGMITFAKHYDPCELIDSGEIRIELVYVTK